MNKKKKFLLCLVLFLLLSSCAQRRFQELSKRKAELTEKSEEKVVSFNPDDLDKFDINTYKTWYESLSDAANLEFTPTKAAKKLSKKEMIEDFEYYFKEISENYPFFDVLKREGGIDFIKNHDAYLEKIKSSDNDEDFIKNMKEIAKDLDNRHVTIVDKAYVERTLDYYSNYFSDPSMYWEFLSLNKSNVRDRYQIEGVQSKSEKNEKYGRKSSEKESTEDTDENSNLTITEIDDQTVLVKIKEMLPLYQIDDDKKKLEKLFEEDKYYKLILDIRSNAGGNSSYWQDFLLPLLINDEVSVENHMFFKDSQRMENIISLGSGDYEKIENVDLDDMKLDYKEDLADFGYYKDDEIKVKPKDGYGFDGQIFLLTDGKVFSAAEGLANFVKNTHIATIVGTKTGGDGITLGMINDVLPNSGLVFTYTNTLGYDPQGHINEEEKTEPDVQSQSYKQSLDIIKNY